MALRAPLSSKTAALANAQLEQRTDHVDMDLKPKKQGTKRKSDTDNNTTNSSSKGSENKEPAPKRAKAAPKTKDTKSKDKEGLTDVSSIHLPGEEEGKVPVFAHCGDIRRQITAILQKPGVSQASFCRALTAASGTNVSTQNLTTFRKKKGKGGGGSLLIDGSDSPAFYASYVYFEKERLLTAPNKKSKHRQKMEMAWGPGGMACHGLRPMWCGPLDYFSYDKYGRFVMNGTLMEGNEDFVP